MFSWKSAQIIQIARQATLTMALLGIAACGSSNGGGHDDPSCPNNAPQSCPATIPSYSNDVAPIIQQSCLQCHGPGGVEGTLFPLQDYNAIFAKRQSVLTQVASCNMPEVGSGVTLDPNDRLTLMTWLVCNAPNN